MTMTKKKGIVVKIFLKNGWFYQGKLIKKTDVFVEFIDRKTEQVRLISMSDINSLELVGGGE